MMVQIYHINEYSQTNVVGYGFVNIPKRPGYHACTINTWRPLGSTKEELEGIYIYYIIYIYTWIAFFVGGNTQLISDDVLYNQAWAERCRLRTVSSGKVQECTLSKIILNMIGSPSSQYYC